jgi:2'-hydroxyisoflavone reductase
VERVTGDRGVDLSPLAGRTWDLVFDPACYLPRLARMSADALRDAAPRYTFVSTLSVYADLLTLGQDETAALATIDDPTTEEITNDSYGALKVLAEEEIRRVFGDAALVLRPGFICGPYDSVDRMPFWLRRIARGGDVLAPESPDAQVQLIDARDIARFALASADAGRGGTFNLCAPQEPYRFGDLLEAASRVVGRPDVGFTWAPAAFLVERGLDQWEAFPWWSPPAELGISRCDASRAFAAGLQIRPVEESLRDCWAWDRTRGDAPLRDGEGLPPEREAELLAELGA